MNLPENFINRIKIQFPDEWEFLISSIESTPFTSVRLNSKKKFANSVFESKVEWSTNGFFLNERPNFTLDPLFHAGTYYVQEASSMFLDHVLRTLKTNYSLDRVLDLCAAPGGKSTLILDHLLPTQFLISNELIENRNSILRENLTKWGVPNFIITQNDSKNFSRMESFFDVILIDAPCSGEGMFRKDPKSIEHWNEKNLEICALRQEEIILNIWNSLKEDGILIYSTCTFNPEENENLLTRLKNLNLDFECIDISINHEWNIHKIEKDDIVGYQFLPHKVKGEGFFCSILRKKTGSKNSFSKKHIFSSKTISEYLTIETKDYYGELEHNEGIFICNHEALSEILFLKKYLYLKQVGIEVGKIIRGKFVVEHGMSLLYNININKFKTITLTKYQSLQFLSKEIFDTSNYSDDIYLLMFDNVSIGFIKQIGHRHNNYYPKNWRILMDWKLKID